MRYGTEFMHEVAELGQDGKMAYGADIHGELNSQAYMDIMYPAGQFDSVDHRRLMAIAERTRSASSSRRRRSAGLFLMKNSIRHDVANLGVAPEKKAKRKKGKKQTRGR